MTMSSKGTALERPLAIQKTLRIDDCVCQPPLGFCGQEIGTRCRCEVPFHALEEFTSDGLYSGELVAGQEYG